MTRRRGVWNFCALCFNEECEENRKCMHYQVRLLMPVLVGSIVYQRNLFKLYLSLLIMLYLTENKIFILFFYPYYNPTNILLNHYINPTKTCFFLHFIAT
jgi:hypothetical protein